MQSERLDKNLELIKKKNKDSLLRMKSNSNIKSYRDSNSNYNVKINNFYNKIDSTS